ncbi:hypothetical protein COU54_04310 [Candidatus Pacearchaeota archaeon CG10_big_fil_rev_8_21_14_0_10_31_24]|nr:MAG: hypothetical protein COU54_04310 [Candidatus Pacearchaeota archaeon CG10_big_fil_rev_8_21_14_0_10_31_24]
MGNVPSVAEIFEYNPRTLNFRGFPNSSFLKGICNTLKREESFKSYGDSVIYPGFQSKYAHQRQQFFQELEVGARMANNIFDERYNSSRRLSRNASDERFIDFSQKVRDILQMAREGVNSIRYMPEARNVLKKIKEFYKKFGDYCSELDEIEKEHRFVIDTNSGEISIFNGEHPKIKGKFSRSCRIYGDEQIKYKMKKTALDMYEQGKENLKQGIHQFVKKEFMLHRGVKNLRSNFEQIAMPVRLHSQYSRFTMNWTDEGEESEEGLGGIIRRDEEYGFESSLPVSDIAPLRPASFAQHYNIRNMFPISLSNSSRYVDRFVPIDFVTRRGERKFIFAGLHSGGKSFLLENLVLASISGEFIGEKVPADSFVLPLYERIFYYRNVDNGNIATETGKAESEMNDIMKITELSGKGDLVVIDEFLDSTTGDIATGLSPLLLNVLNKSKATVFVSTHRVHNFKSLQKNGWTIMSPEHQIKNGIVMPSRKLKRSIPDEEINKRYIHERFKDMLIRH